MALLDLSPRSKYHNHPTVYAGRRYHSAAEARYARQLDLLTRAGQVTSWEPQVRIPLRVNGYHICVAVLDFAVQWADGRSELLEVKGHATDTWRLKRRLLEAVWLPAHPGVTLRVIDV